jgi:hypothetical protein
MIILGSFLWRTTGAGAPPPPPVSAPVAYGPALTEAERERWFGDYESPLTREEKRKKLELQRRIEAGVIKELIVPVELRQEVKEVISETVKEEIQTVPVYAKQRDLTPLVTRIAFQVASELVLDLKRERTILRQLEKQRIEDEEENELLEAITIWMMQ